MARFMVLSPPCPARAGQWWGGWFRCRRSIL